MKRETIPATLSLCLSLLCASLWAQQPTGSILGIVTDPSGGVVPGAAVTVTNRATQATLKLETTLAGAYAASSLPPGEYELRVEAAGFKMVVQVLTVEVGRVMAADFRLEVGRRTEIVTVEARRVAVNPVQTSLEGVVTTDLARNLPLNGRNFLDLGQLEPGVQIQDGSAFDTTKGQYVGLSMDGPSGRTTRVTLDGVDVSDELVGTTTLNDLPDFWYQSN
jgi:hypothetical protein